MYFEMFEKIFESDFLHCYDSYKCIGDLGEKWCNFKWRLWNLHLNPRRRLHSPVFTTRLFPNMQWYLEVDLSNPGELQSLEISLKRLEKYENTALTVDVCFKIIRDGKVTTYSMNTDEYDPDWMWESSRKYTVPFYKTKNDYLELECKLRPNKILIQNVCHRNLDESLPIDLRRLLLTGELYDSVIRVGNYQLTAHIAILQARLPQLLKKCLAPSKEDGKYIININDLPLPIVKEMIKYAYTGQGYVDAESFSIYKEVCVSYSQNFFQSCFWEDHPFAKTFFSYETDSLSWRLNDVFIKSNLGSQDIKLLKLLPNKFTFSLNIESEKDKKWLIITSQFGHEIIKKPTIISCKTILVNEETNETLELGDTESLLQSYITKRKMKICSLLDVLQGVKTLRAKVESLVLRTVFKFCYGSSKSSIENIYEEQFNITKCTGCLRLSEDMLNLFVTPHFFNIIVESEDRKPIPVHKAILLTRWPGTDKIELKNKTRVLITEQQHQNLRKFLRRLYTGKV